MNSQLATLLTLAGILFLLVWDARRNEPASAALWLPVTWLCITGSRFVSQWLELGGPSSSSSDGSPIDAAFFLVMICAGAAVLMQRRVSIAQVLRDNLWLFLFIAWGLVSIAWSDESFIALKRWFKTLGHPVMVLVVLTSPDPKQALRTVLKRCAFVLLPLSVLFIKYWPQYGRGFDSFTGEGFNNGAGLTKNDLGYVCMVSGIFFVWNGLCAWALPRGAQRRNELCLTLGALLCVLWLLAASSSATSMATLAIGVTTMLALGQSWVSKRRFGLVLLVALALGWLIEVSFDAYASVIALLGRDPTLTDRTVIWADVLALQQQPLIGYGFESFWFGNRLEAMWAKWWWQPNQAHNGYIETYLHLGLVGLTLLALAVVGGFQNIVRSFDEDFELARLRMGLLLAILVFNYTEAGFKAVHFTWTIFYFAALRYGAPAREPQAVAESVALAPTAAPR
jgi:exopolysaccharide production protein ExoQ